MRNPLIDFQRGLIMLFVVFAHALQTMSHGSPADPVHLAIRFFQMPALFLISGFLSKGRADKIDKPLLDVISKKARQLLLPTVVWTWLWFFIKVSRGFESLTVFRAISVLWTSGFWFLRELFVIYVVHAVLSSLLPRRFRIIGAIALLCAGWLGCAFSGWEISLGLSSYAYYITFYEVGVIASSIRLDFVSGREHFSGLIFGCMFAVLYFALYDSASTPYRWFAALAGCLFVFSIGRMLFIRGNKWVRCVCEYSGINSLAIYAVHWNLLFVSMSWLYKWIPDVGGFSKYVVTFMLFLVWMLLTVLMIKLIRRSSILSLLLFGERQAK